MLNRYRYICYEDDGVSRYQCLSCYRDFGVSWMDYNFCPNCGIKWAGEHKCRPRHTPRWAWEYYKGDPPWDLDIHGGRVLPAKWEYEVIDETGKVEYYSLSEQSWRWSSKVVLESFRSRCEPSVLHSYTYRLGKRINGKFIGGRSHHVRQMTRDEWIATFIDD